MVDQFEGRVEHDEEYTNGHSKMSRANVGEVGLDEAFLRWLLVSIIWFPFGFVIFVYNAIGISSSDVGRMWALAILTFFPVVISAGMLACILVNGCIALCAWALSLFRR